MCKEVEDDYAHIHDDDFKQKYYEKRLTNDLVTGSRDEFMSLNGEWNYSVDIYNSFLREAWYKEEAAHDADGPKDYSFSEWDTIQIPSTWNNQKDKLAYYEGTVIFHKKIQKIETNSEKVFLRIGAANYESMIFINKTYVGMHEGGFTPFLVDITEYLKDDENTILIYVNNRREQDRIPSLITDWFNYGGLFRDIELYKIPKTYIKDYFIYLIPDGKYNKVRVEVNTNAGQDEEISVSIGDLLDDKLITDQSGNVKKVYNIEPRLWSTDSPYLYNVNLRCGEDSISDEIGFRQIEAKGNNIFLNGEKIFLKGISTHEDSVKNGRALTEDERRETLKLASDMNCNFIRLAHYPHHENMAKLADKLGILLWEEIPVYWSISFDKTEVLENGKKQLKELINRDKNRASVIIWSVGNENPDTDARFNFMSKLIEEAQKMDPSRLTSAACLLNLNKMEITDRLQDKVDVIGINEYFEWYFGNFGDLKHLLSTKINKPIIISEFGGGAYPGKHGDSGEMWTEENQKRIYKKQLTLLTNSEIIAGITPWILYDFKTPKRMNKYQKMYNLKGLVDKNKKHKKLAYYLVQKFYKNY